MVEISNLYLAWIRQGRRREELVSEKSKSENKDLLLQYRLLLGAVISLTSRVQGRKPVHVPIPSSLAKGNEYASVLLKSFLPADRLLFSGEYLPFAAVLKQQVECLAAMRQLTGQTFKEGKVPNVRNVLPFNLDQLHRNLQRAAHLSDSEIVGGLAYSMKDGESRFSRFPSYSGTAFLEGLEYYMLVLSASFVELDTLFFQSFALQRDAEEVEVMRRSLGFLQENGKFVSVIGREKIS